jgi:hypothetical protein
MSAGVVPSSEYLISTALITENTPNVTFDVSSFAGIYKHLQICYTARSSRAAAADNLGIRFNGVTSSSYSHHRLTGDGSNVVSYHGASANTMLGDGTTASTTTANAFSAGIIDILDPYSTSKNKTVRAMSGTLGNENRIRLGSGLWMSTASITSATMFSTSGGNFVAGSRFSIYGIK